MLSCLCIQRKVIIFELVLPAPAILEGVMTNGFQSLVIKGSVLKNIIDKIHSIWYLSFHYGISLGSYRDSQVNKLLVTKSFLVCFLTCLICKNLY